MIRMGISCRTLGVIVAMLVPLAVHASPPNTLAEAIPRSDIGTHRRVPILIINPQTVRLNWEKEKSRQKLFDLYKDDKAMPPLPDVLEGFDRQLVSCTSVQVVAPLMRVVLNPIPGPVEDWARVGRERAARMLFASFTASQWAAASSTGGIGLSDLSKPKQKAWFQSLIPEPFVLRQVKQESENGYTQRDSDRRMTIAPGQARLRVVRTMSWLYRSKGQNSGFYGFGSDDSVHKAGDTFWVQDTQPGQESQESYRDRLKDVVRIEEPNKLKKSDLSFNDAPLYGSRVTLSDVKTVGDLVQRVAEKTGLELYADRRLAGLSVTVVGAPDVAVDTADVMKALCYAFAGAIRKVSDASGNTVYLLTGDREGMMAPRLRLAEWATDVDSLLSKETEDFTTAARDGEYIKGVGFGENAPGLSAGVMARVEADMVSPNRNQSDFGYPRVAVSDLPSDIQQRVNHDMTNRNSFENVDFDRQNIYAQFSVKVELLVPGYGSFSGPSLTSLSGMLKYPEGSAPAKPKQKTEKVALPPALSAFAALKIAPKTDEETDTAITWARKHGFNTLFLPLSLWSDDDAKRLAYAIEHAKNNGIKVYPIVSLLKAPAFEEAKAAVLPNNLPRVRNVLGETLRQYAYRRKDSPAMVRYRSYGAPIQLLLDVDWLDVEAETVRTAVAARLQKITATPGTAGIVLGDAVAPGYGIGTNNYFEGSIGGQYGGYNDTLRVALIRQTNIDPLDVPPGDSMPPYINLPEEGMIPYFPMEWSFRQMFPQAPAYHKDLTTNAWTTVKAQSTEGYVRDVSGWNQLRLDKNREWLGDLRKRAMIPDNLPLYWQAPGESYSPTLSPWTAPWNATEALPPLERGKGALLSVPLWKEIPPEYLRNVLEDQITTQMNADKTKSYSGIVIDTTAYDLDKALALLDCLKTVE